MDHINKFFLLVIRPDGRLAMRLPNPQNPPL